MHGQEHGLGLFQHFKNYWAQLWPEDAQTKWTDLILTEILENQFIALIGPASSWKTGTVSRIGLMDWSVFPDCTTILQSSTDMEGLRSRVYGETTKLWTRASDRYEWFPGHPIDSKCVIAYHDIDEDSARDQRDAIVGVPCKTSTGKFVGMGKYCFSPDTPIDTPSGPVLIRNIKVGDVVFSAIGESVVTGTSSNISPELCRITFTDGHTIDCTPDHPFLTSLGWVNAVDLLPHHNLLSMDETLRILRTSSHSRRPNSQFLQQQLQIAGKEKPETLLGVWENNNNSVQEVLQPEVPAQHMAKNVCLVQERIHTFRSQSDFLFALLRSELEDGTARYCRQNAGKQGSRSRRKEDQCWDFGESERTGKAQGCGQETQRELRWVATLRHQNGNVSRIHPFSDFQRGQTQSHNHHRKEREARSCSLLQNRPSLAEFETGRGSGWFLSQIASPEIQGYKEGRIPFSARVDSVKILKQAGDEKNSRSGGGYQVHNIEVEGHPSYSVRGCIVHNSGRKNRRVWSICDETQFTELSFLQAQNNLISNGPNLLPGIIQDGDEKGMPVRGYKCVFIGNPNPSRPENTLHVVAEPEGGFSSIPDDGKTKTWNCRQVPDSCVKARAINLDGADSPNNEYPDDKPRWVQLVNRARIKMYQEGSEAYWSQGRGVIKLGLAGFKIITADLCTQFHAFDQLIWKDTQQTKIGMVDAAYSGIHGDRCPVGYLEFGKCSDEKIRILLHPPVLVPVVIKPNQSAEDQIAIFCKKEMETAGVPPENFFFDGRGSLAMSFARIWSPQVNSVEFGGKPTDRIVGPDAFIIDEATGQRRLKKAYEAYAKFLAELWWSARYAIESDQIRGITMDVVMDAAPREWEKVKGDKIDIEPKKLLKKRTGISCDLADWFVIGVEGARRRGFSIDNLAVPTKSTPLRPSQLHRDAKSYADLLKKRELHIATVR